VNSVPETVTRQRRGCDLNPDPAAFESSTLTTRLPSHHSGEGEVKDWRGMGANVRSRMRSTTALNPPAFSQINIHNRQPDTIALGPWPTDRGLLRPCSPVIIHLRIHSV